MFLYEELLLLALDRKKGNIHFAASTALPFCLTGAILAELYLSGKISIVEKKLVVIDQRNSGTMALDEALQKISTQQKEKSVEYWIETLVNKIKNIQDKCIENLLMLGILQKEKHKFIFIPYYRYPEYNPRPELDLRDKIKQITMENQIPQDHFYLLLVLVKACNLVNIVFDKQNRKAAKTFLNLLVDDKSPGSTISTFAVDLYKSINNAVAASTAATATTTIITH